MSVYLFLAFWMSFGAVFFAVTGVHRRKRERDWRSVRASAAAGGRESSRRPAGMLGRLVSEAEAAGIEVSTGQLVAVLLAGILAGAAVGLAATGALPFALFGAAAGLFVPGWWLRRKIEGRARAFDEQLEKGLSAMVASLQAGSDTIQAVEEAARQAAPPLKEVLDAALSYLRTGDTLPEALEKAARKVRSRDMELVTAAITVNLRTGARLVTVLEEVAESIRERKIFRAQVAARCAQAKAAGNVLAAVPLCFLIIFRLMNPEYMKPLTSTAAGQVVLAVAFVMFGAGWLIVRRLLSIEDV
ncbi:tight adherence protein B [Thermanaeromonas toyohensis ToBE]|uniref:Tight adherence protein B n=1 Tax=Thermanaeromonas toyohensis ToBE TaxID=698762 RepID=A0A1W1VT03_9FIRM|nr:type II secretion system F family protein [Thermanaeromonas toyohensis]SMB96502.1 tight adherence protein B [Thermanaeromonas toyohensis ToBE]